ncbi:MAG: SCO family protein [Rhodospirillales bacterium]|nr:MAG: SCO family protein [Rhodospirillales bacterium]
MAGCGGRRTRFGVRAFWVRALCAALIALAAPVSTLAADGDAPAQQWDYPDLPPLTYGGPFTLLDHTGRTVTDADFRGAYMLLFFGYTHCPDVCPTGLGAMAVAMDLLGRAGNQVQPIFVTVDPKRDTVEVLAEYVGLFHPRLIGLTGTSRQVHEAAKAYHVHYTIAEYKGEILVGHTSRTYLVGPDGKYIGDFAHGAAPEDIAARILRDMDENDLIRGMETTQ